MNTRDSLTEIGKIMAKAEQDPITILDVMALINRRFARAEKNFSGGGESRPVERLWSPHRSDITANKSSEYRSLDSLASRSNALPTENPFLNSGPVKSELGVNLSSDHPKDAKPVCGSGGDVPPVQDQLCRQVAVPPGPKTHDALCAGVSRVGEAQEGTESMPFDSAQSGTRLDSCGLSANSILAAASHGPETK